jgi:tRNA (cmo5U34)-methyltransferase
MENRESSVVFDKERAASYDERFAKLAPLRDALHLLIRTILAELPADAQILCVGVGTGSELICLAQSFPQWQFTAVEPAAPMLDICRRRAAECGIISRCTFHDAFDAATCLLVSHFLMQPEERRNFFSQIAARLSPDGYLVSADIVSDMSTSAYSSLLEVWLRLLRYSEMPAEEVEKFRDAYGRDVAVLPPHEVESIIAGSGFSQPVLFFQTLLIHAWYPKKGIDKKCS